VNTSTISERIASTDQLSPWLGDGRNTPFKLYKELSTLAHQRSADHPLAERHRDRGGIRHQFVDVIDITPTVLNLTGLKAPGTYHGISQKPNRRYSIATTFKDASAPDVHHTQYFEQLGHRAIWQDGWKLVAEHKPGTDFDADKWELYDINKDFSETKDLSGSIRRRSSNLKSSGGAKRGNTRSSFGWTRPGSLDTASLDWSSTHELDFYPGQARIPGRLIPIANRNYS